MLNIFENKAIIERLFPFYIVVNKDLKIKDFGRSLKKLIGNIDEEDFNKYFKFLRPGLGISYEFNSILKYENQIFILESVFSTHVFRLKGEFVCYLDHLVFFGSPWIGDESDFVKLGLKLRDFALHETGIDMLHNLTITKLALADLKLTNEKLTNNNAELIKINQELDNFVYIVSHDLRTPILSLSGILDLMDEMDASINNQNELLVMAKNSVSKLDNIIKDILEYSRNSRLNIQFEYFDVVEMAHDIFDGIKYISDIPVNFIIKAHDGNTIYSDRNRIKVLLSNLIGNAVKYRNKNIENPSVYFSFLSYDNRYEIVVADNGEGIDEQFQSKVFEMFFRASNNSLGSGLGLYICTEIVTKLNGNISLVSDLAKGSTFTVVLPNTQ